MVVLRLNLKYWRNKRVMTILELSLKAKVSTQTIVKVEKQGHYPKPSVIKKLAQALNVELDQLVLDDEVVSKPGSDKTVKVSRKKKVQKDDEV